MFKKIKIIHESFYNLFIDDSRKKEVLFKVGNDKKKIFKMAFILDDDNLESSLSLILLDNFRQLSIYNNKVILNDNLEMHEIAKKELFYNIAKNF